MKSYGLNVDEKSLKLKQGSQTISTIEGYIVPLDMIHGLAYMHIWPHTDQEWKELPHVIFTADIEWDPDHTDHALESDENWYQSQPDMNPKSKRWLQFRIFWWEKELSGYEIC